MDEEGPVCVQLRPEAGDIDEFHVEGEIDGSFVHAEWDGCWVIASAALLVRAQLVVAVDDAFAGRTTSRVTSRRAAVQVVTAELLLRAMVVACDPPAIGQCGRRGRRQTFTSNAYPAF
jgi:hypothetical protein